MVMEIAEVFGRNIDREVNWVIDIRNSNITSSLIYFISTNVWSWSSYGIDYNLEYSGFSIHWKSDSLKIVLEYWIMKWLMNWRVLRNTWTRTVRIFC